MVDFLVFRSRLDGEKPEEDEIRTKEDGQEDKDGKEVGIGMFCVQIVSVCCKGRAIPLAVILVRDELRLTSASNFRTGNPGLPYIFDVLELKSFQPIDGNAISRFVDVQILGIETG